jgi:NADH-quinone oxidoreductase subunit M
MTELHFPWLEACILIPLIGGICVGQLRDAELARKWCVMLCAGAFAMTVGAWLDFYLLHANQADDRWHLMTSLVGRELFVVDQLSAPLLPLVTLLYVLTAMSTLRTKLRRFSFAWMLVSESITLATFACKAPWGIIALVSLRTVPLFLEMRARGKPTRVFVLHMATFVTLLVVGWWLVEREGRGQVHSLWAILPLLAAILIRSGIAPFHCWVTDLFEHATFGAAVMFVTPIAGAYLAVRLMLPIAPDWALSSMGILSLITAVYAAGMAFVQKDARRFFCYLFLSHSSLVLVGLAMATPIGLTGALCVWLSIGLAMAGFGLTLRALEARLGRLSLANYQGLYDHTPDLAMCFLLTGLAGIGFPGTFGFIGTELLVNGAVATSRYVGVTVVIAAALNGIAVVYAYFLLFTGKPYFSTVSLLIRGRERYVVLTLASLILLGGLFPQPGVVSRHRAAEEILSQREPPSEQPIVAAEQLSENVRE